MDTDAKDKAESAKSAFVFAEGPGAFLEKLAPGVDKQHAYRQMAELAGLQRHALRVLCAALRDIGVVERSH